MRIQNLVTSMDWYAELKNAYLIEDWKSFLYCLNMRSELNQAVPMKVPPLFMAFESGDPSVIRGAIASGADINQTVSFWQSDKFLDRDKKNLEKYLTAEFNSYHDLLPITALVASWEMRLEDLYQDLLLQVNERTMAITLWWALATGQEDWARSLKPSALVPRHTEIFSQFEDSNFRLIPPHFAAIFGNCSMQLFREIWELTAPEVKTLEHVHSPHYGHDNDISFSGNAFYWAKRLGRTEIEAYLREDTNAVT